MKKYVTLNNFLILFLAALSLVCFFAAPSKDSPDYSDMEAQGMMIFGIGLALTDAVVIWAVKIKGKE